MTAAGRVSGDETVLRCTEIGKIQRRTNMANKAKMCNCSTVWICPIMRTKKKRRRLTVEKTIRCCGQGENMEKYGFGVDVGGTSCKLGLFTDSGKLMEKWEIPTDTSEQGEHIIEHVAASLEHRQRERGLADEQIIGRRH